MHYRLPQFNIITHFIRVDGKVQLRLVEYVQIYQLISYYIKMEHGASKALLERIAFGLKAAAGNHLVTSYMVMIFKILMPIMLVLEAEKQWVYTSSYQKHLDANPDLGIYKTLSSPVPGKHSGVQAIKAKIHDSTYKVFSSINILSSSRGAVLTPLDNTKID